LPTRPTQVESPTPREGGAGEEGEELVDLNSTHMFTLNSSARLLPDGSLDYSDREAFNHLPITPLALRRQKRAPPPPSDIPPLDLAGLRTSTDSTLSSLNFQPYTGSVRSTDTYRPSDLLQYQYLGAVPEAAGDLHA
jgi:hypothetical protein